MLGFEPYEFACKIYLQNYVFSHLGSLPPLIFGFLIIGQKIEKKLEIEGTIRTRKMAMWQIHA